MIDQPFRLSDGGLVDRARRLRFRFDGRDYEGYEGDTLASALLANGIRVVGRSFKYHRPRGILTAGPEEPNALVQLRKEPRAEPNTPATTIELFDNLVAKSQNCWPSLKFDVMAFNQLLSPLFPAGFYYKTFMWPAAFWEPIYEKIIRRAAGLGLPNREPDPDLYEKFYAHCDVLVVGGGPAGLAAALAAGESGARVILADERPLFGGSLNWDNREIAGSHAGSWVEDTVDKLGGMPEVRLLPRTTVFGYYDHNMLGALERVADHLPALPEYSPRQRYWQIRARRVVIATGAIERPMVFTDNDRPGVMLASAVRTYVNQYAVRPGSRAVVFTNNDDAYRTALDLHRAGVEVAAVVDSRTNGGGALSTRVRELGIQCLFGHAVIRALGGWTVKAVQVAPIEAGRVSGSIQRIACDLIAVSGGWSPCVHLYCHAGGKPVYRESFTDFVPGPSAQAEQTVGAANGAFSLGACIEEGYTAGSEASSLSGWPAPAVPPLPTTDDEEEAPIQALWETPEPTGRRGKKFVELQGDVTAVDIALSAREGYSSVEHLKRYTTQGMWTDQGKTGDVNALAILAENRKEPIPLVGTTAFRPPYTPVAISAYAGYRNGLNYRPVRRTPMYEWHVSHGAVMVNTGLWKRSDYYPRAGEGQQEAINREVKAVRGGVGLADTSTLGKVAIRGPDAAEFLNRVYCNGWKTLKPGRARFGLMLREDGIILDDGTTSCIAENVYHMTTSTAHSSAVLSHMEFCLQCLWPNLRVHITSVTEHWAVINLSGPNARKVLAEVIDDTDVSNEGFPCLGVMEASLRGIPVRLFRISYSGELSYEINVPVDFALDAWRYLMAAGKPYDIVPFGAGAMTVMRVEKGHVSSPELDGRVTARDVGMGRMMSTKKEYIGRWMAGRSALIDPKRPSLVGFVPADRRAELRPGALIVEKAPPTAPEYPSGRISTVVYSPNLGHWIGLGFISGGLDRKGKSVDASFPLKGETMPVEVVDPLFFDPEGERLNA